LNRKDTNNNEYLKYTIPLHTNKVGNYGIAITGLSTFFNNKTTVPISINVNKNYEFPSTIDQSQDSPYYIISNIRPNSISLILTVTVSELIIGETYSIYKFNDVYSINYDNTDIINISTASNNFNLSVNQQVNNDTFPFYFTATDTTFIFKDNITSDQQAIYNCCNIKYN
jgi:hypothetical protein